MNLINCEDGPGHVYTDLPKWKCNCGKADFWFEYFYGETRERMALREELGEFRKRIKSLEEKLNATNPTTI